MASNTLTQLARRANRQISPSIAARISTLAVRQIGPSFFPTIIPRVSFWAAAQTNRSLTTNRTLHKGLSRETENPQPKEPKPNNTASLAPADVTIEQYNELSDQYLDALAEKLEQLQDEGEDVDSEYSAGVLKVTFPRNGTYVISKQPLNKQIWLSSPLSEPKRYDFVMPGEGHNAKEDTGSGEWIYLRDKSSLSELLLKEIGVDMSLRYTPVPHLGE
ncbi:hypothetical protein ACEPPN_018029 [Leptodophora sp. 'Broadleaf-Isolate-01']